MPESMGSAGYLQPEGENRAAEQFSDRQPEISEMAEEDPTAEEQENEPSVALESHRSWRDNWLVKNRDLTLGGGALLAGALYAGGVFLGTHELSSPEAQQNMQLPAMLIKSGALTVFSGALASRAYEGVRGFYEDTVQPALQRHEKDKEIQNEADKQQLKWDIDHQEWLVGIATDAVALARALLEDDEQTLPSDLVDSFRERSESFLQYREESLASEEKELARLKNKYEKKYGKDEEVIA